MDGKGNKWKTVWKAFCSVPQHASILSKTMIQLTETNTLIYLAFSNGQLCIFNSSLFDSTCAVTKCGCDSTSHVCCHQMWLWQQVARVLSPGVAVTAGRTCAVTTCGYDSRSHVCCHHVWLWQQVARVLSPRVAVTARHKLSSQSHVTCMSKLHQQ